MARTPRLEKQPAISGSRPVWRSPSRWLLIVWLAMVASGATTTGLLRSDSVNAGVVQGSLIAHEAGGFALGALAIVSLLARGARETWRAGIVLAVLACGWLAIRTFAPTWGASHAVLAACTAVAVTNRRAFAGAAAPRWQLIAARLAFVAMLIQVAAGALLRHRLIELPWHVLFGGVAALLLLVAAVPSAQEATRPASQRRAARMAIAALLTQVGLGVSLYVMLLIGSDNAPAWIGLTTGHVVMGTLTLVAASLLVRDHRRISTVL